MHAEFERFDGGCIRVFGDGQQRGDDYPWACSVKIIDKDTAEIKGVDKPLPVGGREKMETLLIAEGFKRVRWERVEDGVSRFMEFELRVR